jgi:hypothetical protein
MITANCGKHFLAEQRLLFDKIFNAKFSNHNTEPERESCSLRFYATAIAVLAAIAKTVCCFSRIVPCLRLPLAPVRIS